MTKTAPRKAPTIQDIARECGVTAMTVSSALSGRGRVAPATQERIRLVARNIGYEPNPHARSLRAGRSRTIVVFPAILVPTVYNATIEAIQNQLTPRGFEVPLYNHHENPGHNNPDAEVEKARAVRLLQPRAICGMLSHLQAPALDELRQYIAQGGQVVGFGRSADLECDQVIVNYEDMAYLATRHLLDLGHRQLGFYGSWLDNPRDTRVQGFRRALAEYGVPENPDWMWRGPQMETGGLESASRFLACKQRPTGMVFLYDATAGVFINQLARAGVTVPEQLSVVTIGDTPLAACWNPALSVVRHPMDLVANHVVQMLTERLDGEFNAAPRQVKLHGQLIPRESSRAV